jgi:microcystin-dependent protein
MQNKNEMKRIVICLITGMVVTFSARSQDGVGIGTETVNASAILQVEANNKGVLIPRIADPVGTISSPAEGLIVFNTTRKSFYYYSGSGWTELNPMPKGGIIMWSGTTPPPGWALCDGSPGTPDLKGRFVVSYDGSTGVYNQPGNISDGGATQGAMGGAASVAISIAEMPSHNHGGVTNTTGAHTHPVPYNGAINTTVGKNTGAGETAADDVGMTTTAGSNGNHFHTISAQGSGAAHENRPPYYVLAYIIKL